MNTLSVFSLALLLLVACPAFSQDSLMVRKSSASARNTDPMPVWKGGNTVPMPNARYRFRSLPKPVPMPGDSIRSRSRRDTIKQG